MDRNAAGHQTGDGLMQAAEGQKRHCGLIRKWAFMMQKSRFEATCQINPTPKLDLDTLQQTCSPCGMMEHTVLQDRAIGTGGRGNPFRESELQQLRKRSAFGRGVYQLVGYQRCLEAKRNAGMPEGPFTFCGFVPEPCR